MKIFAIVCLFTTALLSIPAAAYAAGGIYASGGGNKTVGQTFTITIAASGADFDSLQGTASVSGPVDIVSFSGGGATWLPGKSPSNDNQFVGICSPTSSLTVATIKLKAKSTGSGSVSVSGVKLARNGVVTGTESGGTDFNILRAPDLPDSINIVSTSHPDPNQSYEATAIALSWNKEKGVDGFSYLLDQAETTVPAAKITSANTSVAYTDQAIGSYFFHIRAHNGDGWGGTTNFKINIKEPDAKIDELLQKPNNIEIKKADIFTNNVSDGTISGIIISGITEPNFTANINLVPAPIIPEGKSMSAIADDQGRFSLLVDFPIVSGFHKLTVQGQKDKILTPLSDEINFEIIQTKGGQINILTSDDINPPVIKGDENPKNPLIDFIGKNKMVILISLIPIILIIILTVHMVKKNKTKRIAGNIKLKS